MTKLDLAYLIGELIAMEMDDYADISYASETDDSMTFTVKTDSGKKLVFSIEEK